MPEDGATKSPKKKRTHRRFTADQTDLLARLLQVRQVVSKTAELRS